MEPLRELLEDRAYQCRLTPDRALETLAEDPHQPRNRATVVEPGGTTADDVA